MSKIAEGEERSQISEQSVARTYLRLLFSFQPNSPEIVETGVVEGPSEDIEREGGWIESSSVEVTGSGGRAVYTWKRDCIFRPA